MLSYKPIEAVIVCNQCDLLHQSVEIGFGNKAMCIRCGNTLYRHQSDGLRLSLIFSITAAALFLISNAFPIVTISSDGLQNSTTLIEAAIRLMHDGIPSIATLVFLTTFFMPALEIIALIYLLLPMHLGCMPPGLSIAFRVIYLVKPWAMVEVFMMGLLVTITKLNAFASVSPDIALGSFVLLMLSVTAAAANFDPHYFWLGVEQLKRGRNRR